MATLTVVASIDRSSLSSLHEWRRLASTVSRRFQLAERLLAMCQQRDRRISKKPSSDLRWEHLFKTVLKDGKKSRADPFGRRRRTLARSTNEAISPICDRCKSPFNFALNGGRFALPVDGPHTTKE